jgi:hypothetical protein
MVQGIARDVMCCGALNARDDGFNIFGLVHDEVLTLGYEGYDEATKTRLRSALLRLPKCYKGLPLDAEVKVMDRYTK